MVFLLVGVHTCKTSSTLGAELGFVNRLQTCRRLTFTVTHLYTVALTAVA